MSFHRSSQQFCSANLILDHNLDFEGKCPSWFKGSIEGEVVFTTGMTGYVETLTDPSYAGQIIVFTYPLIGNYGVPNQNKWESHKIFAKGLVVGEISTDSSHFDSQIKLTEWLHSQNIPFITGVDTRRLVRSIREYGSVLGAITTHKKHILSKKHPHLEHLVSKVSPTAKKCYSGGNKKILLIDCGAKESILRSLQEFPVSVDRVPYNVNLDTEEYDGIVLSNGPGDPTRCPETVIQIKKALKQNKPIFGICLGCQILALSCGATTFKLPFGHRGHNQPCIDLESKRCYITSQNHGYAIDEKTLPKDWEITFKNLNDGSIEGIKHKEKPFFAVQFHPEAFPGPLDTKWLFESFYHTL